MPKRRKIFYGWWIAITACFIKIFNDGAFFYGFTTFFNPIRHTFGWSAAATSIAFTLQRLEMGALGPLAGFMVDRVGPRRLIFSGWVMLGLGFILMSRINSIWAFYGTFLLIATGASFGALVPIFTAVATWFDKKRSRAMAIMFIGPGLSGLIAPVLALSIGHFGWRETLVITGVVLWSVGLPLSFVFRHRPEQYGYLPDGEIRETTDEPMRGSGHSSSNETAKQDSGPSATGFTAREALKTRAFWLICAVSFFQHLGTSAVMVHIVPYLESVGVSRTIAALGVTGMTVFSLIGRLGFGFLGDYFDKRYLMTIAMGLQTIGIAVFSFINMDNVWLLAVFLLTYGPGYGGPIPVRPALQGDYFGTRSFGAIIGLMSAVAMLAGLSSPVFAGWIFDTMGSYRMAWRIFALSSLPAVPLMLLAKPPKARREG